MTTTFPDLEPGETLRLLDGPPGPGVVEVIDADGRRWYRDEESLTEIWRNPDVAEALPPEVLAEVFGELYEVLDGDE
ncbi:hypothetical protein AB0A95_33340 [Micromonospora sp. NPDC049230]|uniref:hypothetical protein n=1 Tax=Micromonospora sp. NPDC049230 TaxID=3155502 RepID=UPI0033C29805